MFNTRSAAVVVLAAMFLGGPAILHAQEHTVGLKGGINIYDVRLSENVEGLTNTDSKTNWAGGLYASLGLSEIVGLQIEALYSRRAFGAQDPADEVDAELKTAYMQVPLLVAARIPLDGTKIRPLLYAGPMVSFETDCKLEGSMEGVSVSFDCDDPQLDLDRKTTDWSVLFGGGFEVPVGGAVAGVEARYNLGLTNLNDDRATSDQSVKSSMWEFMASVGFPIRL
jgi:hypothetical protein